ncbi:MAG TPA: riboflavin synthase [Stellaceae bacterium]|nr:riboflavin synthase [Stellaceae bacterium]
MFTGIITDVGTVRAIETRGDMRITVATRYPLGEVAIGASIACSGPCLTVVEKGNDCFSVDASAETLARTTVGSWRAGTRINLERALKMGDELGGHLLTGHVDTVATLTERRPEGDSLRLAFSVPEPFDRAIASKGAVAIDGVSLTVNEVDGNRFGVNIIPHTQRETTLGALQPGDRVNLEIDLIARYLARLVGKEIA